VLDFDRRVGELLDRRLREHERLRAVA